MMIPLFIVTDVTWALDGGLAVGGTDEYLDDENLDEANYAGRSASLLLRGGRRIDSTVQGLRVHVALTGRRNVYVKLPKAGEGLDLKGAILSVEH